MKQIIYILVIFFFVNPNEDEKRFIQKIDFRTDYQFSSEIETTFTADSTTVYWKYDIAASQYAIKGDYQNALRLNGTQHGLRTQGTEEIISKEEIDSTKFNYSPINAKDYIIEQSKNNQVVIINEKHHNPFHRIFTKSLLQELYKNGYTNLGLEALTNIGSKDSMLHKRGYPIQKTGYDTKEPQFGDLIRTALDIGYNVFPYENTMGRNGKLREIEQAQNIKKVIDAKPNEKFLIYCGYDHVLEGELEDWGKAMAGRLTEYTGINPLTIDQVLYSERSIPDLNHPLLNALNVQESSVLIDKENQALKYETGKAWADLTIVHPTTQYINNRPDWLFKNGNQQVSVKLTDIEIEYPVMVLAFKKDENIHQAVPMDITEIATKNDKCTFALKKGEYVIIVTNRKDSFLFEQTVK